MVDRHQLGPEQGTLQILTFREGVAQKVGHDLVIAVERWSATVTISEDGTLADVGFEADSESLSVLEGHNGLKPLSDKDRKDIRGSIDDKVLKRRPISFASTAVQASDGGVSIAGDLTMAGHTRPASFALQIADGRVRGTLPVLQSAWDIKPYKAFMGALKVRDEVQVAIDVALPVS